MKINPAIRREPGPAIPQGHTLGISDLCDENEHPLRDSDAPPWSAAATIGSCGRCFVPWPCPSAFFRMRNWYFSHKQAGTLDEGLFVE